MGWVLKLHHNSVKNKTIKKKSSKLEKEWPLKAAIKSYKMHNFFFFQIHHRLFKTFKCLVIPLLQNNPHDAQRDCISSITVMVPRKLPLPTGHQINYRFMHNPLNHTPNKHNTFCWHPTIFSFSFVLIYVGR